MATFYLFAFDPNQANEQTMHELVDTNELITDWWHGMGNTYLFTTAAPFKSIHKSLAKDLPKAAHLLIQVDLNDEATSLPQAARDWVKAIE